MEWTSSVVLQFSSVSGREDTGELGTVMGTADLKADTAEAPIYTYSSVFQAVVGASHQHLTVQ